MTDSIEVKTFTVSARSITIAMYRQLFEAPLINHQGTLNGEPWGHVNRHAGDCQTFGPHLHVVWRNGNDLYRDRVATMPGFARHIDPVSGPNYVNALVRASVAGADVRLPDYLLTEFFEEHRGVHARLQYEGAAFDVARALSNLAEARKVVREQGPKTLMRHWQRPTQGRPPMVEIAAADRVTQSERDLDSGIAELPKVDLTEARQALHAEMDLEADRRERQIVTRQELTNLDQLFIGH